MRAVLNLLLWNVHMIYETHMYACDIVYLAADSDTAADKERILRLVDVYVALSHR